MPKYEEDRDDDDDDDVDSIDSEVDYEISHEEYSFLNTSVDINIVNSLYKSQRGMCRVSGMPLTFDGSMYSCKVSQRRFNEHLSGDNILLVSKVVYDMRNAANLPWRQFISIIETISQGDF